MILRTPGNTENVIFPLITWDQAPDHRYASSGRLTVTPGAIVGGLRRVSKATANARDAVARFVPPTLPFSLLVRNSYRVKNTRLTIRRFPRSFVILANYPARVRARTHRPTDAGVSHGRDDEEARISDSQSCDRAIPRCTSCDQHPRIA